MKFSVLATLLPLVDGNEIGRLMTRGLRKGHKKVKKVQEEKKHAEKAIKGPKQRASPLVGDKKGGGIKHEEKLDVDEMGDSFAIFNFAQLSSSVTQENGVLGTGTPIENDSIDALLGISYDPSTPTDITISENGAYFALAAPQIGATAFTQTQVADYFMKLNGENIDNSNVRYTSDGDHADVIITQGVLEFVQGDILQVLGSGENSNTQVVAQVGEPLVPSIIFSIFELGLPVYAQLSSTQTQVNGELGIGVPIQYDSIDALSGIVFPPLDGDMSKIVISETGAYFALAAPQIGAVGTENPLQTADYFMKINGVNVGNSNVRYRASSTDKDVIITQGVLELNVGDELQVYGSGINSATEAISIPGEPLVPSIIFSIFKLAEPVYCQLSSSLTQQNGPLGTGIPISFSNIDAISGIGFDMANPTQITILTQGTYFALAAPQISAHDPLAFGVEQVADYFFKLNGQNIGNSNVRYQDSALHEDVIITQGVLELLEGDVIEIWGSGVNSDTAFIQEANEPDVPSIIYSMFLL